MAVKIDYVQGVKPAVALDIPGSDKIHLVYVVAIKGLSKVRILNTFGHIYSFF